MTASYAPRTPPARPASVSGVSLERPRQEILAIMRRWESTLIKGIRVSPIAGYKEPIRGNRDSETFFESPGCPHYKTSSTRNRTGIPTKWTTKSASYPSARNYQ